RTVLVAVTGASNVTGEVLPIAELTAVAHRHGARIVVDAAQLAPHRAVDIAAIAFVFVALSGHKLYAPYGSGVLIGRRDWLHAAPPPLARGGGGRRATPPPRRLVPTPATPRTDVDWSPSPARHEAGTPNVVGAVALAAACRALAELGMGRVAAHDEALTGYLRDRLDEGPGIHALSAFGPARDRG